MPLVAITPSYLRETEYLVTVMEGQTGGCNYRRLSCVCFIPQYYTPHPHPYRTQDAHRFSSYEGEVKEFVPPHWLTYLCQNGNRCPNPFAPHVRWSGRYIDDLLLRWGGLKEPIAPFCGVH